MIAAIANSSNSLNRIQDDSFPDDSFPAQTIRSQTKVGSLSCLYKAASTLRRVNLKMAFFNLSASKDLPPHGKMDKNN